VELFKDFVRPMLFSMDPESVHRLTERACQLVGMVPPVCRLLDGRLRFSDDALKSEIAGLKFDNPVGLAAGWDKNGRAVRLLAHLGFGFVEIGSVSSAPCPGNPPPRLFRLTDDRGFVVNYGLRNDGAEAVAERLAKVQISIPLGINIVSTVSVGTKTAPEQQAQIIIQDYVDAVSRLFPLASYITLNLSCPNRRRNSDIFLVPGVISQLLQALRPMNLPCPVFLKIAPDNNPAEIERILSEAGPFPFVRGFLFNLTSGKPEILRMRTPRSVFEKMPGAVSGEPVEPLINLCIREMYRRMPKGRFALIGPGGIFSAADAYKRIRLGASLVQVFSALAYEGPWIVRQINEELCELLDNDGFKNISEAVGQSNQRRPV
jgi:dihydroorotate dehydrogenase